MTINTITRFLADLNGSHWITDDGPGGADMRQRAKWAHRAINRMDARLVEAAPDLLEALREARYMVSAMTGDEASSAPWNRLLPRIDAAIAKATGGDA